MRHKLLAEMVGTFALVFVGTGAITVNDVSGGTVSHVGIALTFGFVAMAMINPPTAGIGASRAEIGQLGSRTAGVHSARGKSLIRDGGRVSSRDNIDQLQQWKPRWSAAK